MFLLRVELAGTEPFQIIVTRQCPEPLLQDRRRLHCREDGSDLAVNFQRCRLVAGCLADHDLLDELTYDVDEGLLRLGIGVLAHVVGGGVDDQLDGFRADLRL
ncbi:hypothetical protein [Rhizobium ruizarguesonis]|uniref:hypothetical protein n=1 Tax=Rhizobium ruizarguesonis TaxID=2081791 RepID=UPI001FE195BD|nr:hypothetical protein [Rhizobium ruizarguesonis]